MALSAIIAFFWISNNPRSQKTIQNPGISYPAALLGEAPAPRTLLVFWASWCKNCLTSLKDLKQLRSTYPQEDFKILALNVDKEESRNDAIELWNQAEITDIVSIYDPEGKVLDSLLVEVLPTYFVFNEKGKALLRFDGPTDWKSPNLRKVLFENYEVPTPVSN